MTNNLPPELAAFVDEKLATGTFATADDVVVACVRDAYQREREEADLQPLLQEGLDDLEKGNVVEIKSDEELDALFEDVKRRGRERFEQSQRAAS